MKTINGIKGKYIDSQDYKLLAEEDNCVYLYKVVKHWKLVDLVTYFKGDSMENSFAITFDEIKKLNDEIT